MISVIPFAENLKQNQQGAMLKLSPGEIRTWLFASLFVTFNVSTYESASTTKQEKSGSQIPMKSQALALL